MFSLYDWLHFARETIFSSLLFFFFPQLLFSFYYLPCRQRSIHYLFWPTHGTSHFVWPTFKPTDAINFNYYQIHQRFIVSFHIMCTLMKLRVLFVEKYVHYCIYNVRLCVFINILKLSLIFLTKPTPSQLNLVYKFDATEKDRRLIKYKIKDGGRNVWHKIIKFKNWERFYLFKSCFFWA